MTKEVLVPASAESLAALASMVPQETGFNRVLLPRLGMFSQDQTEGKGKSMVVTQEAGTFFTDHETDEVNEEGKKVWAKDIIEGKAIDAIIIYQRKQLRYYDEANETYHSSPIYDTDDETVVLFHDKKEIARGTPAELKARPEYQVTKDGKTRSKLEENKILYVLYNDELYQMNLRGTSMYAYADYARKTAPTVAAFVTSIGTEAMEKGSISWTKMVFAIKRALSEAEVANVIEKVTEIKNAISAEKSFYASADTSTAVVPKDDF